MHIRTFSWCFGNANVTDSSADNIYKIDIQLISCHTCLSPKIDILWFEHNNNTKSKHFEFHNILKDRGLKCNHNESIINNTKILVLSAK